MPTRTMSQSCWSPDLDPNVMMDSIPLYCEGSYRMLFAAFEIQDF